MYAAVVPSILLYGFIVCSVLRKNFNKIRLNRIQRIGYADVDVALHSCPVVLYIPPLDVHIKYAVLCCVCAVRLRDFVYWAAAVVTS